MKVVVAEYQLVRFEEVDVPDDFVGSLADIIGRSGLPYDAQRQVIVSIERAQTEASVHGPREQHVSSGEHFAIIANPAGLSANHSASEGRVGAP